MTDTGSDATLEIEKPAYDSTVAMKKVGWAIAKLTAAQLAAPGAIALFQATADKLKPLGITVIIDQGVLEKALPGLIFMVLVAAHDAIKVKTGKDWL